MITIYHWLTKKELWLPLTTLLVHLVFIREDSYFRDELYYLACSRELAWGYVDHPPGSVALLWVVRKVFGDSLHALRLFPALASALTVALAGSMARTLGGDRGAQRLAMLACVVAPAYLALGSVYSMNAFELAVWAAAAALLLRALRDGGLASWATLGVLLGVGLLNKHSVLWLGGGIALGLVTTRRELLTRRGPWLALTLALAIFSPHLAWQWQHDWPTVAFMGAAAEKMALSTPLAFLQSQVLNQHPLSLPLWLAGLWFFLMARDARPYRVLGVAYLFVFVLLAAHGTSRPTYLTPAYTMLFAAGAVAITPVLGRRGQLYFGLALALGGALTAPLALPMFDPVRYVRYAALLGFAPHTDERRQLAALPQFMADMEGWRSVVEQLARSYHSLPPDQRQRAAILTSNYGEAGAVDHFGPAYGLPPAISGHNAYWHWGPRGHTGEVILFVAGSAAPLREIFASVQELTRLNCRFCMPYERDSSIFLCRAPKRPLAALWPELRHYD